MQISLPLDKMSIQEKFQQWKRCGEIYRSTPIVMNHLYGTERCWNVVKRKVANLPIGKVPSGKFVIVYANKNPHQTVGRLV